jgi:hypothetical protein
VQLAITVDAVGNLSGTITQSGATGTMSGSFHEPQLTGSYSYPDGTSGTVAGTLTSTGANSYSGNLTITSGGQQYVASCTYVKAAGSTAALPAEATTFCNRTGTCSGSSMSSSDLALCQQMASTMFQLVPDPDYTSPCLQGLSCTALQDATSVQSCLDLNDSSVVCNGSTLHGCSNSGKCSDISCPTTCGWLGMSFDHCGFDSTKNRNVCFCAL